ncbi:MAG: response regulator [bacterium]|nr:response regulator [bacterium]
MKILILDDDTLSLHGLENALRINGYNVSAFLSLTPVEAALAEESFDVVITDYHLPGQKGTAVIQYMLKKNIPIPVIIISGDRSPDVQKCSIQAGAYDFFRKPLDIEKLIACLDAIG